MSTPTKNPGMGVDGRGNPVIDPTANVIALVEAESKRLDQLRHRLEQRLDFQFKAVDKMANLRAKHADQLAEKESSRLDAIRQVDVLAVSAAAAQTLSAVTTLATTTSANAENIRLAVVNTATTMATQLTNTVTAINERLAALERSSYEGKGKSEYQDPVMSQMILELKALREIGAGASGRSAGVQYSLGIVLGIAAAAGALGGLIMHFVK